MESSKLPVYNATRELYLQIHRSTQKCPADIRRGCVAALKERVRSVMVGIANANEARSSRERLDFIEEAERTMRDIEIEVRSVYDLGFLRRKSFAAIIRYEDNVLRQLAGWAKKTISDVL